MGRSLAVILLLAGAASAEETDPRERCDAGDAAACRKAATRAARIGRLSLANELRTRANALEVQAPVKARAESLADLSVFDDETPKARDERVENLERLLSVPLVEADVGDHPRETASPPPPRAPPVPRSASAEVRRPSSSWPRPEERGVSSRFGVVALLGGELVQPLSFGRSSGNLRLGVGPRFSLLQRTEEEHQVLPAVSLLLGAVVNGERQAFFTEARIELLVASSGPVTMGNFALYGLAGFETAGQVNPYVGLGLGWNWLPKEPALAWAPVVVGAALGLFGFAAGPVGLLIALGGALSGLAFDGFLFAGHIELRYFPLSSQVGAPRELPLAPTQVPNAIAILFGVGA